MKLPNIVVDGRSCLVMLDEFWQHRQTYKQPLTKVVKIRFVENEADCSIVTQLQNPSVKRLR